MVGPLARFKVKEFFLLKAAVAAVTDLETFIGALTQFGETNTLLVLSSPLETRILEKPEVEENIS